MMLNVATTVASDSDFHPAPLVLIVDDHQPSLEKLKALVEQSGYPCVAASSGTEALIYCDQNLPALVITDLSMPRLNGDCLARWLKARFPDTPILLLTGSLLTPELTLALSETFIDVMQKPLDVEPFVALLDSILKL